MTQAIIYLQDNGVPAVMMPTPEALQVMTIHQVAVKDVPTGKPFAIVDVAILPSVLQEAWVIDEADLMDGIGGQQNA
ncbi:hypothetical protein [Pusillimonas sp. NJUB218]|uniref:hypothetical protein n=1 Tax=Pusillimonas sp. NJUB218 TaxID=2023230 RepID=UPI000F4CC6A2|nr:hypothetical protein [Pusillimonas sp. NJUB218]ROT44994.1 hypothetical protein CHR62_09075 [Pusillimonas sp. NJUB218]